MPANGTSAAEAFVSDDAEGVDVGAAVDVDAEDLFGRHVRSAFPRGGPYSLGWLVSLAMPKSSTRTNCSLPYPLQHDVRRLDVAVDDAEIVRLLEDRGDIIQDLEAQLEGKRAVFEELIERLTLEKLHDDVPVTGARSTPVIEAYSVGVGDSREREHLIAKTAICIVVCGRLGREDLDRDPVLRRRIDGFVDGSRCLRGRCAR